MPLSKIVAKSITDDTITTDQIADTSVHGARNLVINGSFAVSQRNSSFSAPNGTYTLDRMRCAQANSADTISQQTFTAGQTDVPGSPKNYLRFAFGAATANRVLETRIEDVYTGSGQSITLSFYAKASAAHTSTIEMTQNFGSGGSSDAAFGTQSYNITTSWQRFEFTLSCPSISGKTVGAGNYLSAAFIRSLSAGPSINVDIALLQLEVGSQATPFEHRSYGEELSLCQRYYVEFRNSRFIGGYKRHDVQTSFKVHFPVSMRATPTVTLDDGGSFTNFQSVLSGTQSSPVVFEADAQFNEIVLAVNSTYSGTHTFIPSWESQEVTFDAEL